MTADVAEASRRWEGGRRCTTRSRCCRRDDPTRATTAGRAYLDLRARARTEGRATDELLVLYVLERFLHRVSVSDHRDRLVLDGGMLLAALDQRRPTRDVDLLALGSGNDIDTVIKLITPILQIDVDDGVEFHTTELTAGTIRDQAAYSPCASPSRPRSRRPGSRSGSTSTWATP